MKSTLVIQSHRTPLPYTWLEPCLQSARDWCTNNRYQYRFLGDELFDFMPVDLNEISVQQKTIASDLARLLVIKEGLLEHQIVVWLDADFLIFRPEEFILPDEPYAVGREVWVQHDKQGKLKAYKKVHNAFLMFRAGNSFLEFYVESATRLLSENTGSMSPQFIGPKLLTALHNVTGLPVMETAGMLSPLVIQDILKGEGPALELFSRNSRAAITGANLCISSCEKNEVSAGDMSRLVSYLLEK